MNTQRDKYLTEEVLGECWHEWVFRLTLPKQNIYQCGKCNKSTLPYVGSNPKNNNFSTPEGFFRLIKVKSEIIAVGFLRGILSAAVHAATEENRTDDIPDRFANAIYEFLKERES